VATVSTSNGLEGVFYADGACIDVGMAQKDGVMTGDEWACARSETATVNLGGGPEAATLRWMNDEERVYFLLQVDQTSGEDVFSLRFDLDSDGASGPSAGDRVVGLDTDRGATFGGSLSNRCAKRSQSSCYSDDGSGVEVEAAVVNADGTTTYELSAPMPTSGTDFGFFFTLSNGNGAKGNTQYPGFRDYRIFMPVVITPGS